MIIHSIIKEEKNKKKMYDIRMEYHKELSNASVEKKELETELNDCIQKLASRKKAIINYSLLPFVDLLGQIKKIDFNESDGIKELDSFDISSIRTDAVTYVSKIDAMTVATKSFTSTDCLCLILGVASLGGIPGLAMGTIAAACTSSAKDSERRLKNAELESERAGVIVERVNIEKLKINNSLSYVKRYTEVLTQLNQLFFKSQKSAREVIDKCGTTKTNYSVDDRKCLATWINIAKAIKDLLDEPILDQNGNINVALDVTLNKSEKMIGEKL